MTLRQLAKAVLAAEDAADDVSLLQCMDELERRGGHHTGTMNAFMEFYWDIWKSRAASREKVSSRDAAANKVQ